jgi:class 3 adenylate cyclase
MWSPRLNKLLNKAIEHPEKRVDVEKELHKIYNQDKAFLVLDMCGFSRITKEQGIFDFLLMIHQMRLVAVPNIEKYNGKLVKTEADNLFCLFDDVKSAVVASQKIIEELSSTNRVLPSGNHLYASIGIGYGGILNIENVDMFGNQVNLACKLGEDIGEESQILLTDHAYSHLANLGALKKRFKKKTAKLSGVEFVYYVLQL